MAPMTWAERVRRVFRIDITTCPEGCGRLRWIADVTEPSVIRKILLHVQSRAPPERGLDGPGSPAAVTHIALFG